MHFRIHGKDKYRELKNDSGPFFQESLAWRALYSGHIKSCMEIEVCGVKFSGFFNAICSRDFIIPGCELSFPGKKKKKKNLITEDPGLRAGMFPFTI